MVARNFLRIQVKLFWALGFDIFSQTKLMASPLLTLFTMGPMTLFILPMASYALHNLTDVDKLTDAMSPSLTGLLCVMKFALFMYYRKDFVELIVRIRTLLAHESEQTHYKKIVQEENRQDQLLSRVYVISCYFTGISATLVPFIKMGVGYSQSGRSPFILPFPGDYPYDNQNLKYYIFSYLWTLVSIYSVITASLCVDTLFCSYTHNVCAHFKIAQRKIASLNPQQFITDPTTLVHAIALIFRFHQEALEIAAELNEAFQPLIFAQFSISSLQICVLGYQAADKLTEPEVLYFSIFATAILIQVFIYAYCGERIKTESEAFATSVYNSLWYDIEPRLARSFVIPLARAQQPCILDGFFFEANLPTFTSIISSAMSYITLLRSFEE